MRAPRAGGRALLAPLSSPRPGTSAVTRTRAARAGRRALLAPLSSPRPGTSAVTRTRAARASLTLERGRATNLIRRAAPGGASREPTIPTPAAPDSVKIPIPDEGLETLFGARDENLRQIEDQFDVEIRTAGAALLVTGDAQGLARTERVIDHFSGLLREGHTFSRDDVRRASELVSDDVQIDLRDVFIRTPVQVSSGRHVKPRTLEQRRYLDAIERHDLVFGIGPAGTGKTYLAMAQAVAYLVAKRVSRIILARPAVEAGEKLGFLPGDLQEKVNPYLRPLYDALYDLQPAERVERLLEQGVIEIAPLAFMRGRTLNDAFVILDEAQNTTTEQMKMFLTRLGFGSKAVVTGDITQIDLPAGRTSGVKQALRVLGGLAGVSIIYFTERDVVRHKLVRAIVKAYDQHAPADRESGAAPGDPSEAT